jgi:cytidylate kinase
MHLITFSRKLGTQGDVVARKVAENMGYRLIGTEEIDKAAREMGFLESVEQADEKAPSLFQRAFSDKPAINLARLSSVIHELAKQGDSVFVGRGGNILLKTFDCALHVKVTASREYRIQNLKERGYSEEAAGMAMERSDTTRRRFIEYAYGVDWDAPDLYDIVLNMDKMSRELAVEVVLLLARSNEIKACARNSIDRLARIALENRVEAAIMEAGLSYGQTASITTSVSVSVPEPGLVILTGVADEARTRTHAEDIVRGIKGVERVENRVQVRAADRHA